MSYNYNKIKLNCTYGLFSIHMKFQKLTSSILKLNHLLNIIENKFGKVIKYS